MARYCIICGHELITESNFMVSDITGNELPVDDDAMVTYAHCPCCECEYEMQDASNSETEFDKNYIGSLKLWNKTQDDNDDLVI